MTATATSPIPVFVGYDRRMPVTFQVAAHSMTSRASRPLAITPLCVTGLRGSGLLTRPLQPNQSTEFSFSRFLVPALAGYQGWAIFMDNDVVVRDDLAKLWGLRDDRYSVMCVQHDHVPTNTEKFLGEAQTRYEKKNWSSVMLLNTARCRALTVDYVNTASGLELHRFHWLDGDHQIGALPSAWNFLVDYSPGDPKEQSLLHYTDGGPYYATHQDCQAADLWLAERDALLYTDERSLGEVFPEEFGA